jgi:hypothetical protein
MSRYMYGDRIMKSTKLFEKVGERNKEMEI